MRWIVLVVLVSCQPRSGSGHGTPTSADRLTPKRTRGSDAATAPKKTSLRTYPKPWDPSAPVDIKTLTRKWMYVIAESASICPTREQAQARKCGHSSEFVDQGKRLVPGERVLVIGDAPFDGFWRAIRYQTRGTLPSWILAEDVADRPRLSALDAFDRRADVARSESVTDMSGERIRRLKPGTLVSFRRIKGVRLASQGRLFESDDSPGVILYVPTKGGKPVAVKLIEDEDNPVYMNRHSCLLNADCLTLDYHCEKDGYCDEISILAYTRINRTGPPKDDEYGDWPKRWKGYFMPTLDGVILADRFGTYTFQRAHH